MAEQLKPGKFLKTRMLKEYQQRFQDAKSFFVTDFAGLTNKDIEELKRKLKSASAKYVVVKNSLCRSALKDMKIDDDFSGMVEGSCAIGYTGSDPVLTSKILVDFSKANEKFKLKGGYVDGEVLSLDTLKELAALPPREVLLARLVSAMNSPVTGFVMVCSSIVKKFLYALNDIIKKKEENKEE